MTEQVKAALLDCRQYQKMLARFNEPKELHPVVVKGIFNTVGIDLIGSVQPSARNNRYIITSVDYLTKNIEARATPDKESGTVADFFWEDVICRHGNVATLISDHGGELAGRFQELLERCHIDHRLSSPHHPQSNGLTERFNETLTLALRKMVADHPEDWDTHLPTILMGYRGSIQASTRFSPFYLLHGYEMLLPVRALDPIPTPAGGMLGQTAQALLENMKPLHEARVPTHGSVGQAQARNIRSYARRTNWAVPPARAHTAKEKGKSHVPAVIVLPGEAKESAEAETHISSAEPLAGLPSTPSVPIFAPSTALETAPRFIGMPAAPVAPAPQAVPMPTAAVLPPAAVAAPARPYAGAPLADSAPAVAGLSTPTPAASHTLQAGDYVLEKKHEKIRRTGDKTGKLADKVEGPFYLHSFTDDSRQIAYLHDFRGDF